MWRVNYTPITVSPFCRRFRTSLRDTPSGRQFHFHNVLTAARRQLILACRRRKAQRPTRQSVSDFEQRCPEQRDAVSFGPCTHSTCLFNRCALLPLNEHTKQACLNRKHRCSSVESVADDVHKKQAAGVQCAHIALPGQQPFSECTAHNNSRTRFRAASASNSVLAAVSRVPISSRSLKPRPGRSKCGRPKVHRL